MRKERSLKTMRSTTSSNKISARADINVDALPLGSEREGIDPPVGGDRTSCGKFPKQTGQLAAATAPQLSILSENLAQLK